MEAKMIPSPALLGLDPKHFPSWRLHQPDAIKTIRYSPTKYTGILAPVGSGKSAIAVGHALWSGERTCILTSTKPLADLYHQEYPNLLLDIRGQANYDCEIALTTVADGPCHGGLRCELKKSGCIYYDLKRDATTAPLVLTNYQMWLHSIREKVGLGIFARVILDESHNALAELGKFLSTRISGFETRTMLGGSTPGKDWVAWAKMQTLLLSSRVKSIKRSHATDTEKHREVAATQALRRKLSLLSRGTPDGWLMQQGGRGNISFECIHPGRYASKLLFQRADKFVLMSASIRPRTFHDLHISSAKVTFKEYPSTFPVARRPIYYMPAIKYSSRSSLHEIQYLIAILDQWIGARKDRKGIIHSVSYERAAMIRSQSKFGALMIGNRNADELSAVIKEFKSAPAPCILVSPSITEGQNFPGSEAEYIVVPKIPFSDPRSPIAQARKKDNSNYAILETCVLLRQSLGRIVRFQLDQGEGLILDEQFGWLHRSFRRFFPPDFNESVKHVRYLPAPPPPLRPR